MYAASHSTNTVNTFNVGSEDWISVTEIADILTSEMGLNPKYRYTGGSRGWVGDVPKMQLDVTKLKESGYIPQISSRERVRVAVRAALESS